MRGHGLPVATSAIPRAKEGQSARCKALVRSWPPSWSRPVVPRIIQNEPSCSCSRHINGAESPLPKTWGELNGKWRAPNDPSWRALWHAPSAYLEFREATSARGGELLRATVVDTLHPYGYAMREARSTRSH